MRRFRISRSTMAEFRAQDRRAIAQLVEVIGPVLHHADALFPILAARIGREASTAVLAVHISLSCLAAAAALVHLYFVYAYTA